MEFTEQQRRVYGPYPSADGTPTYADPLLTHRHLRALLEGDIGRVVEELNGDNAQLRHQATLQAAWATCEVFGLPQFDPATGQGTKSTCALALFTDFLLWVTAHKKSGGTTPDSSSPESIASPPPPCPTS